MRLDDHIGSRSASPRGRHIHWLNMNELRRVGESKIRDRSLCPTAIADHLRCRRKCGESGFSIVELLITCMVLLTVSAIAVPHFLDAMTQAKDARAVGDVRTIGNAILGYEVLNQRFPATLTDVGYGANKDPWGQPYQYVNFAAGGTPRTDRFGVQINTYFDLYSMGKDRASAQSLTAATSQDDIVWADDGGYDGMAMYF
jgi:general secretion pathway protein G